MQMNKVKIYSNKIPDDVLEMAQYTYEHVPLYADLAAKASKSCLDFEMLPIVGKRYIYERRENVFDRMNIQTKRKGKIITRKDSGQREKLTDFFWDEKKKKTFIRTLVL